MVTALHKLTFAAEQKPQRPHLSGRESFGGVAVVVARFPFERHGILRGWHHQAGPRQGDRIMIDEAIIDGWQRTVGHHKQHRGRAVRQQCARLDDAELGRLVPGGDGDGIGGVRRATAYARAKLLSRNMLLRSRIPPSSLWVACIAALPGPRVTTISAYAVASPTPRPDRDDRARRRRASPATASPAKTNPRLLSVLAGWRKKASRACSQNSIPRAASGPNHPYATASTNPVHPIRAQTATARNTLAG